MPESSDRGSTGKAQECHGHRPPIFQSEVRGGARPPRDRGVKANAAAGRGCLASSVGSVRAHGSSRAPAGIIVRSACLLRVGRPSTARSRQALPRGRPPLLLPLSRGARRAGTSSRLRRLACRTRFQEAAPSCRRTPPLRSGLASAAASRAQGATRRTAHTWALARRRWRHGRARGLASSRHARTGNLRRCSLCHCVWAHSSCMAPPFKFPAAGFLELFKFR